MFEEEPQQTAFPISSVRMGIAITFFILAVPLGVWVLTTVKTTIDDTKKPAILQKISAENEGPIAINTPSGKVELPPQLFKSFPYMILFMYLLIPTTITIALIKGGVALLNPNLARQLSRFVSTIQKTVPPKQ